VSKTADRSRGRACGPGERSMAKQSRSCELKKKTQLQQTAWLRCPAKRPPRGVTGGSFPGGNRARRARTDPSGARGHPAVVARRPHRPRRPGGGGDPPRGLRQRARAAAARARRPRAHRQAAAGARHRQHPRRHRVRGGAHRPVRPAERGRRPHAPAGRRAPARRAGREPARRGPAQPPDHPAARPLPHPVAQHRPRFPRHRSLRDGPGVPASARRAADGADPRHRPGADRFRAGRPGGGAAGPAALDRRCAGREP